MSRKFKAIVFDFDGLIADTEVPVYEAWRNTFRSYGAELPLSVWTPHIGKSHNSLNIYAYLEELTGGPVDREEVRRRNATNFDVLFEQAVPLPGVEAYIDRARAHGLRIAIASSSTRAWVHPKLEKLGLSRAFESVVCSDDVGKAKPDPASYLKAFALEDLPNGVQAAKNAGLLCVAVPGVMTRDHVFDHADLRIESLADTSLEELILALS